MNWNGLQSAAQIIAALAALLGGIYAVVTRPIMALLKAEMETLRAEIKAESAILRTEIKTESASVRGELAHVEMRLNERIDTRLIHR